MFDAWWEEVPGSQETRERLLRELGRSEAELSGIEAGMLATLVAHETPWQDRLHAQAGSAGLLADLEGLDLEQLDEAGLVEVAAAAQRVASRAQQIQLRAAATLTSREPMNPQVLAEHTTGPAGVAGDCLALRLRCSKRQGHDLVRRGHQLSTYLTRTEEALAAGVIDQARAVVIADGVEHVPWQVAIAVEGEVIERAPGRTPAQLRADVAAALIAVDPDEAHARAQRRRHERRVTRPRAHPDGVASLRVEGPVGDVLALDLALDGAARAAKASGDTRTLDQLRFDALTGLGHHALATGTLQTGALDTPTAPTPPTEQSGQNEQSGRSGSNAGWPVATRNGHRPSVHVTMSLEQLLPEPLEGATGHQGGSSASHRPEHTTGRPPEDATGRTLEGATDPGAPIPIGQVPVIEGYGPIDPATARALAAGGIWRRLVTDPLTGSPVDIGTTRYTPPAAMADRIRARDRTCVRPGCTHPASEAQLDHTTAYNDGGHTSDANLGALCTRDHLIKTHGDFTLTQPEPGIFEWTTPTGHRYRRERDGTTTDLTPGGPRTPGPTPAQPGDDEDPPF
ncbi:DUF222 domain-containing protein [Ruania alkalisoli]|uniref:DUF222 domain-containing protein n=1 Tax=Ruania alkalisoli TaxID=2779775 RepID=A0A7M1SUM3_9MICO|nr:HNH endonuclease signature motif containing protein [Ruania alkalisoli]QOR71181.1 DUF222 domain-containing protein [Ruania alkalisoli]